MLMVAHTGITYCVSSIYTQRGYTHSASYRSYIEWFLLFLFLLFFSTRTPYWQGRFVSLPVKGVAGQSRGSSTAPLVSICCLVTGHCLFLCNKVLFRGRFWQFFHDHCVWTQSVL